MGPAFYALYASRSRSHGHGHGIFMRFMRGGFIFGCAEILGERGLGLVVHFPSGCIAKIYTHRDRDRDHVTALTF